MDGTPNMKFVENKLAMVVMDGPRVVAKASRRQATGSTWLLKAYSSSWTDPRARTEGLFPGKFPYLLTVKGKAEARRLLKELARIK